MGRRRFFITFCFTIFITITLPVLGSENPEESPLMLWSIEDEDTTLYLMGTIHILPSSFTHAFPYYRVATMADYLALEVDISTKDSADRMVTLLQTKGMYPQGKSVEDDLPPQLLHDVKDFFGASSWNQFKQLRPWALNFALIEAGQFANTGLGDGHEQWLFQQASQAQVLEVEGVDAQVRALASLSLKDQIGLIRASLNEGQNFQEELERMVEVWQEGDLEQLTLEMEELKSPTMAQILLFQRNHVMADKAVEYLNTLAGTVLMAVGCGHFLGEQGIPALLEEQGLTVKRLYSSDF
ncbi:MAG: TraB/GumN family protein [Spirochaetales bacterium]|nr:TraB/GumN family protein [Spirochaetales bacterium]